MSWRSIVGDARDLPLADASLHAVVTDPPYGISFMGEAWDHEVPGPEFWLEMRRVLKPGGMLLAFGGTRKWHWLAAAIEVAGFQVRDALMWMYGQGAPKSRPFGREVGWEGWDVSLKPAWEPILLAMKPTDGTFAQNATIHGVAGLNVGGCGISYRRPDGGEGQRWPANVLLSHTAACDVREDEARCPRLCPVRMVNEQSGAVGSNSGRVRKESDVADEELVLYDRRGEGGGASRFFYCAKPTVSEKEAGLTDFEPKYELQEAPSDQFFGARKEGRQNIHPTVKPINLCRWLVRLVTRPGHRVLDPFMGSGSVGCAAVLEGRDFVGVDLSARYTEIAEHRIRHWSAASPPEGELPV